VKAVELVALFVTFEVVVGCVLAWTIEVTVSFRPDCDALLAVVVALVWVYTLMVGDSLLVVVVW